MSPFNPVLHVVEALCEIGHQGDHWSHRRIILFLKLYCMLELSSSRCMLTLLWLPVFMNVFKMPSVKVCSSENKARPECCLHRFTSNCSHTAVTEFDIFLDIKFFVFTSLNQACICKPVQMH